MICMFCFAPLTKVAHAGTARLTIKLCRNCQGPRFKTLYRELHYSDSEIKLYDQIKVDEFIITRHYISPSTGLPVTFSNFYKESIGILENHIDATPIDHWPPVFQIDHIVNLSLTDLDALKRKLKLWTTFS